MQIPVPSWTLRKRSARPLWQRRFFKAFTVFLGLLVIAFAVWRIVLYREISGRFAAIRAAHLPDSGTELNRWRLGIPDADNAAIPLTEVFAQLHELPDRRSQYLLDQVLLLETNPWPDQIQRAVVDYVTTNAHALPAARAALRRPACQYPIDFSYGPDTAMPHLGKLKDLALLAALQARMDTNAAPDNALLILKLAATLNDEPAILSFLVRGRMVRMAGQVIERYLQLSRLEDSTCQSLDRAFRELEKTNQLSRALIGERAMMIPVFRLNWSEIQHAGKTDGSGTGVREPQRYSGKPNPLLWVTGLFERDLNFYLQVMETNIGFAALPPPNSLAVTNATIAFEKVALRHKYFLSTILTAALDRCFMRDADLRARIRLARTALAVERFRAARGRIPREPEELVPDFLNHVPADPFDGAPLRLRLLPTGYCLYSVDKDGHDNQGRARPDRVKSTDTNSYDITFIVERNPD